MKPVNYVSPQSKELRKETNRIYRSALCSGKLIRPDECSKCGASESVIHGHHENYWLPLDVIWLCYLCHAERHKQIYRAAKRLGCRAVGCCVDV